MITRIRNWLRTIRYHSARRRGGRWTRAREWAIAASFFLALPCALLAETVIVRVGDRIAQAGGIERSVEGGFRILPANADGFIAWSDSRAWGEYEITQMRRREGWPTVSRVRRADVELSLRSFDRIGTGPDDAETIERAVVEHLRASGQSDLADALASDAKTTGDRRWLALLSGAGFWWMLLTISSVAIISILQFIWKVLSARGMTRAEIRRARNQCVECGYSLRGLEFSARCPECGGLVE